MKRFKKIRRNFDSFGEVLLFLQIFFLITILPFLIKLLTVPQLMKILTPQERRFNGRCDYQEIKDKIVKYTDYILSRNYLVYKNTCLKRSLILYHFLRKVGIDTQICFGVRYKKGLTDTSGGKKLEGHAWLLYNGDIFLETNSEIIETYKMTYCFPDKDREKENNRLRINLS